MKYNDMITNRIKNCAGIILGVLLMTGCSGSHTTDENSGENEEQTMADGVVELTDEQIKTVGITIGKVEHRQMSGTVKVSGTLKLSPQNRAEVTSLVSGQAKRILVKEGDVVRAGQTLALVENTDIVAMQKEYLVVSRQLTLARQAFQRQETIHSQGAGVEKNLQQAKSELEIAQANEQGIRVQLQQMGISASQVAAGKFVDAAPVKSPISGVVGEVLISTGSYLDNQTVLMNVYDNSAIHADLNVFESDISNIRIGQEVDLQLFDKQRTLLSGNVSFITASLDKASKSASVHVDIQHRGGVKLLPNMFVSASIHCEQAECMAVPDEAVVMSGNRYYVFVPLGGNKFQQTEVTLGLSQQGYTQIAFVDSPKGHTSVVTRKAVYLFSMIADHGEE